MVNHRLVLLLNTHSVTIHHTITKTSNESVGLANLSQAHNESLGGCGLVDDEMAIASRQSNLSSWLIATMRRQSRQVIGKLVWLPVGRDGCEKHPNWRNDNHLQV